MSRKLPEETKEWIRSLMLRYRTHSAADTYRVAVATWREWKNQLRGFEAIPGYTECPPAAANGVPAGWNLRAFARIAIGVRSELEIRHARASRRRPIATRTNHGATIEL